MKTLIEESITIKGMGRPDLKTIFSIKNDEEKSDSLFRSLSTISGRKLPVDFKYDEMGSEKSGRILMSIPFNLNEEEVSDFILEEINNSLI